ERGEDVIAPLDPEREAHSVKKATVLAPPDVVEILGGLVVEDPSLPHAAHPADVDLIGEAPLQLQLSTHASIDERLEVIVRTVSEPEEPRREMGELGGRAQDQRVVVQEELRLRRTHVLIPERVRPAHAHARRAACFAGARPWGRAKRELSERAEAER